MSIEVDFRWHGDRVARRRRDGGARGLGLAGEHVLGVSNNRVPHQTGALQTTGTTGVDEGAQRAAVSYDGPYAVVQHEDLTMRHDNGRRAKYLESAMVDEQDTVADIIARALRRELEG